MTTKPFSSLTSTAVRAASECLAIIRRMRMRTSEVSRKRQSRLSAPLLNLVASMSALAFLAGSGMVSAQNSPPIVESANTGSLWIKFDDGVTLLVPRSNFEFFDSYGSGADDNVLDLAELRNHVNRAGAGIYEFTDSTGAGFEMTSPSNTFVTRDDGTVYMLILSSAYLEVWDDLDGTPDDNRIDISLIAANVDSSNRIYEFYDSTGASFDIGSYGQSGKALISRPDGTLYEMSLQFGGSLTVIDGLDGNTPDARVDVEDVANNVNTLNTNIAQWVDTSGQTFKFECHMTRTNYVVINRSGGEVLVIYRTQISYDTLGSTPADGVIDVANISANWNIPSSLRSIYKFIDSTGGEFTVSPLPGSTSDLIILTRDDGTTYLFETGGLSNMDDDDGTDDNIVDVQSIANRVDQNGSTVYQIRDTLGPVKISPGADDRVNNDIHFERVNGEVYNLRYINFDPYADRADGVDDDIVNLDVIAANIATHREPYGYTYTSTAVEDCPGVGGGVPPIDTDNDGIPDDVDIDDDNDGILDTAENGLNAISVGGSGSFGSGTAAFGPPLVGGQTAYTYRAGSSLAGNYAIIKDTASVDFEPGIDAFRTILDRSNPGNGYYAFFDMGIADRGTALFQETLTVKPNTDYEVSFWLAGAYHRGVADAVGILGIEIDGTVFDTAVFEDDTDWRQYTFRFTTDGTGTAAFALINNSTGGGEGSDVALDDIFVQEILDSDGDSIPDAVDLDSDNDGIPDNVEAQTTAGYIAPASDSAATYTTNKGLNSAYLGGLTPVNTDGTDEVDYVDTDSDNDGFFDIAESGQGLSANSSGRTTGAVGANGLDSAAEGEDDFTDPAGNAYNNGTGEFTLLDSDSDVNPGRANAVPMTTDYDFREASALGNTYFIQQNTNRLYAIDLATGAVNFLANTSPTGNMNAMAYDEANQRLWYVDGVSYELYAFDLATNSEIGIIGDLSVNGWSDPLSGAGWTNPLSGGLADGAAWYDGAFYVGTASSDNLYKITFNGGYSAVTDVVKVADINGNSSNTAWGDFSISQSGVLYGADAITGAIFSYDILAGGPRQEIAAGVPVNGIQLGANGKLYGIHSNAANGPLYTIDVGSGTSASHANTGLATSPGDLAGPIVAGPLGSSVTVSVADLAVDEGDGSANIVFNLSAFASSPVSVDYTTANDTATAGLDYTATSGTVTFPTGITSASIVVPILADSVFETLESFHVNLSNPSGATISDNQATVSISDCKADIIFLMDQSGSISGTEWANMTASANGIIDRVLANSPTSRIASAVYSGATDVPPIPQIWIESDFSSDPSTAKTFNWRRSATALGNSDDAHGAVGLIGDALDGVANAQILSPQKTLSRAANTPLVVFLFTDATRGKATSWLVNSASPGVGTAGAFANFTAFKNTRDASFVSVIVPVDSDGPPAAAAIASAGGSYTGAVEANPADPDGSGSTPRMLTTSTVFNLTDAQLDEVATNICQASEPSDSGSSTWAYSQAHNRLFRVSGLRDAVASFEDYGRFRYNGTVLDEPGDGNGIQSMGIDSTTGRAYFGADTDLGAFASPVLIYVDLALLTPGSSNFIDITAVGTMSGFTEVEAIAFDNTTGVLYAVDHVADFDEYLHSVDTSTGATTNLGRLTGAGFTISKTSTLDFDSSGNLYALDQDANDLFHIDTATGAILGREDNSVLGNAIEGMVWDPLSQSMIGFDLAAALDITLGSNGANPGLASFPAPAVGPNQSLDWDFGAVGSFLDSLRIGVADTSASEGASVVSLSLSISRSVNRTITVDYVTANGTANAGDDFVATSGTATFSAGTTSTTIDVALLDDSLEEGLENFFVNLSNPTAGTHISDNQITITLIDNDSSAQDSDGDSVPDITDIDDDNDGILDTVENGVNAISAGSSGSFGSGGAAFGPPLAGGQTAYPFRAGSSLGGTYTIIKDTVSVDFSNDVFRTVRDRTDPGNGYFAYFDMGVADRGTAMFQESLTVMPNTAYEISFWLAGPYHHGLANSVGIIGVEIDGVIVDAKVIEDDTDWKQHTYRFTSDATGTAMFALINNSTGGGEGSDVAIDDILVQEILDTDGDGIGDIVDLDSDNDGIPDNVEAQTTAGYILPNNDSAATYASNQGLNSAYLGGLTPVNSDSADVVDYLDSDSDNDGIFDISENGDSDNTLSGNDSDGDGLDNAFDSENVVWDVNDRINDPNPGTLGDIDQDVAPNGDNAIPMIRDVDYRDLGKQSTYASWASVYALALGGLTGPDDNPDGDLYDNLLEYAICLHPGSGTPGPGGFFLGADATGNVHARFYRPKGGLSDVTYQIHGRSDLPVLESETWSIMFSVPGKGTPPRGVTVTDLGLIEEVRIDNLQAIAPLTPQAGFVRLAVSDGNHSSYAPVWGWTETVVEAGQSETYANPFNQPELLSGVIGAIVGTHGIDVSAATDGVPLEADVQTLVNDYYIEIIEGQHVGHRFDVASVLGSTIILATDTDLYQGPPYNTQVTPVGVPTTLTGNRFILRKHYSLEDMFPPSGFTPQAHTFVPEHPADRVYLYESDWEPYWLYANSGSAPFWDLDGDSFFVDAGRKVIPPGGGIFLAPQETTVILVGLGIVRKNPFAMPLPQGWSLQASPFPLDQGPAERYMNRDTFVGSDDPATSDTVCFWLGNGDTYQPEFRCAFLYDPKTNKTPRWLYADDPFLTPRDFDQEIFPRDRSSFYFRYNAAKPEYMIPLPWCIGLIGE